MSDFEPTPLQDGIAEQIKETFGLENVDSEIINMALKGYNEGSDWVRRKFQRIDRPTLMVGDHQGVLTGINGYTELSDGRRVIALQVNELRKLEGAGIYTKITDDHGEDVPERPVLTIQQWYESFGVEETLHWLQDQENGGTEAKLPEQEDRVRPDSRQGIPYLTQPHEWEGLKLRGEFFKEKYKTNPLSKLEKFIQRKIK